MQNSEQQKEKENQKNQINISMNDEKLTDKLLKNEQDDPNRVTYNSDLLKDYQKIQLIQNFTLYGDMRNGNNYNFLPSISMVKTFQQPQQNLMDQNYLSEAKLNGKMKYQVPYFIPMPILTKNDLMIINQVSKKDKDILYTLKDRWEDKLPNIMSNYSRLTREEGFAHAFVKSFQNTVQEMTQALQDAGFVYLEVIHASLIMLQHLIKKSNTKQKESIFGENQKLTSYDNTLNKFFNQTTDFVIEQKYIINNYQKKINSSIIKIFFNNIATGEISDPAIHINLSMVNNYDTQVLEELQSYLVKPKYEFAEIKFEFSLVSYEMEDHFKKNYFTFIKQLLSSVKSTCLSLVLKGTKNLRLHYEDNLVDIFLQCISEAYDIQRELRKLIIENCFISTNTFNKLAQFLPKCELLKELELIDLQLENILRIQPEQYTVPLTSMICQESCTTCVNQCFYQPLLKSVCFCGLCCQHQRYAYTEAEDHIIQKLKQDQAQFNQKFKEQTCQIDDFLHCLQYLELDIAIFRNTFLPSLMTSDQINIFLQRIAQTRPYSVCLAGCGINDRHFEGLATLFQQSSRLMHIDLTHLDIGIDTLDMIDKYIKTSPFIISMPMSQEVTKNYQYFNISMPERKPGPNITQGCGKACCCLPNIFEYSFEQKISDPIVYQTKQNQFKEFQESIKNETKDHRLLDYLTFLNYISSGDEKKKKKINKLIVDNQEFTCLKKVIFSDQKAIQLNKWVDEMKDLYGKEDPDFDKEFTKFNITNLFQQLNDFEHTQYQKRKLRKSEASIHDPRINKKQQKQQQQQVNPLIQQNDIVIQQTNIIIEN